MNCPQCHGSNTPKKGKATQKDGSKVQKYLCKDCNKYFLEKYKEYSEKFHKNCEFCDVKLTNSEQFNRECCDDCEQLILDNTPDNQYSKYKCQFCDKSLPYGYRYTCFECKDDKNLNNINEDCIYF